MPVYRIQYPAVRRAAARRRRWIASLKPSISATETTLERGQSGQAVHIVGINTSWTNGSPITISAGTITGQTVMSSTTVTLNVAAPGTIGLVTFTDTLSGATCTINVVDTVAPNSPTGVSLSPPVLFSVPINFTLPAASPTGETITGTMTKNGSTIATSISGTTYTFSGVANGDVLGVKAVDNAGNASSLVTATFVAASGGMMLPAALQGGYAA